MSGDYSRETFDALKDFRSVLMQQGRVQLDADWNELVEILDRRLRAETTDTIGRCTVPKETPDGFNIGIAGQDLTIGRGRIYVHGLLAENHGEEPSEIDAVLSEVRGTKPVSYYKQPYFPNAKVVARLPKTQGPHLVYIDVWSREVTYLKQPNLIENAVGVDTTTRMQTAWQVKVVRDVGYDMTCATPDNIIPGWTELTRPSAGRLSTAAVGVATSVDPCKIPPSGGYRGLENRLYRVEIHNDGPPGKATFKWSRDNASVATNVTAISALRTLTVARTGRDSVLRFNNGDWVEITDDWLEFAQKPGLIGQIEVVDEATQTITLTEALPSDTFATNAQGHATRHTRICRWDQKGKVYDTNGNLIADLDADGSIGVVPVPAGGTSIILEDGVQITFTTDPAGGEFRIGDYWTFAARTADASIDELRDAPPRGIHHHYSRLALVTMRPDTVTDCRVLWPPDVPGAGCDCSVCVTEVSHNKGQLTIQRAVDQLKAIGGTVCLGTGVYDLGTTPVRIADAKSIRIKGQGYLTILSYIGSGSAITIERSIGATIEEMTLLKTADDPSPAVSLQNWNVDVTLQRCLLLHRGSKSTSLAVGLRGVLLRTRICENVIFAPTGIGNSSAPVAPPVTAPVAPSVTALTYPTLPLLAGPLCVQNNALSCSSRGISLTGLSIHVMETNLSDNFISDCPQGAIVALGLVMAGMRGGLDIQGNMIQASGPGIVVGTDGARLSNNDISAAQAGGGVDGIVLDIGYSSSGIKNCQVLSNRITDVAGDGVSIRTRVLSGMISQNVIAGAGGAGILMNEESSADILSIANNQLLRIAPQVKDPTTPKFGIRLVRAGRAEVVSNSIIGVAQSAIKNPTRGIQVIGSASARIVGNEIADIGPEQEFARQCAGIECLGTFDRVNVIDNRVQGSHTPVHIEWTADSANIQVVAMGANKVFAVFGTNALVLPRGREIVGVQGNLLEAHGEVPAVFLNIGGAFVFNSNRCLLDGKEFPAVSALAGAVIANANYLKGPKGFGGLAVELPPRDRLPYTILGNITSGTIKVNNEELPDPWKTLNLENAELES